MDSSIIIREKDNSISWEAIALLLQKSHFANKKLGVVMKTAYVTPEVIEKKVSNGKTIVALTNDGKLVGTASFYLKTGHKWYDKNKKVAFWVYLAVDPDYQGKGIAKSLYIYIEREVAKLKDVSILESGTAEKNVPQRMNFKFNGFVPVELTSNRNVDYYSVIYIKVKDGDVRYPLLVYKMMYAWSFMTYKALYKPGKISRARSLISVIFRRK